MRNKRGKSEERSGYYWMDTYGDLVTLLLTFFVLLYSMSSIDNDKWKMLAEAMGATKSQSELVSSDITGVEGDVDPGFNIDLDEKVPTEVVDFSQLYAYLKKYVSDKNLEDSVRINKVGDNVMITFQNHIFFNGDSAVIRNEGKEILEYLSTAMKNIGEQIGQIKTFGHTAKVEGGNFSIYWDDELSSLRASHVCSFMRQKLENIVEPQKLSAEGMGRWRPAKPHDGTEATRKVNRRVEICIAKKGTGIIDIDNIYQDIKDKPEGSKSAGDKN